MPSFIDRARSGFNSIFDRSGQSPFKESGVPGYQIFGGYLTRNEKNPKLAGSQRYVEAQEILTNLSIIAASTRYFLNLVAKPTWKVEPADESSEAQAVADFCDEVMNGMATNWSRAVRRAGMYRYHGFGISEWVAQKRDDGKIGLADIEPRPWHTIERWDIDAYGNIKGVEQRDPQTGGAFYIPRSKMVYFVDDLFTDSPEGQGWFRSLMEPADRMRAYLEIEQLGFQRDMSGIPVGRAPLEDLRRMIGKPKPDGSGTFTAEDITTYTAGLQNFIQMQVKQKNTSLLLDSATYKDTSSDGSKTTSVLKWGLDLLTGKAESMPEMGKAIERLTFEMARVMGTESILLGTGGAGSLALSKDKSQNLYLMVNSTISDMAECYERDMIQPLCKMNGIDEKLWPSLMAEDVAFRDVEAVAATLRDMATAGAVLAPDDPAIDDVRDMLGLQRYEGPPVEMPLKPTEKPDDKTPPDGGGGGPDGKDPLEKGFDPNQPRNPAGSSDGGRWASIAATVGYDNPLDDRERIIGLKNTETEELFYGGLKVSDFAGEWHLDEVRSITRGGGRKAMEKLVALADDYGKEITLFAVPLDSPAGLKMSKPKLRNWYKQFGFASHENDIDRMVRKPTVVLKAYNPNQPRDPAGTSTGGQFAGDMGADQPDVIFEVAPNPDDKELSGRWDSLSDEQKAEITKAIAEDVTPKVLKELGIEGQLQDAMGGYEGKINPSLALNVSGKPFEAAGILGEALSQKAMVVASDKAGDGLERLGMVGIAVSDASKLASVQGDIVDLADGFTYRNGEMQFLNFTGMDDGAFANQINDRLGNAYKIRQSEIYSNLLEEKDYASGKSASKGNARREFRDLLKRDVSQALDTALKGFGKAFQIETEIAEKKYNPNQPRNPAGSEVGGRWSSGGGGSSSLANRKGKLIPITPDTEQEMMSEQAGKSVDELIDMAEENQDRLQEFSKGLSGVQFKTAPETKMDDPFEATPKGRKSISSVERKLKSDPDYNGPGDLKDISRGTFVVGSLTNADTLIREMSATSEIYDKGWKKVNGGYFDRKVYIRHPNGGLSEIQIIPKGIYAAKSGGGHDLYETYRSLKVSPAARKAAHTKMTAMYAKAITGSGFEEIYDGS